MRFSVDTSELHALAGSLHLQAHDIEEDAERVVAKVAHDVTASAQGFAPVDTGNLKNSIGADIDGLEAVVGPTVDYGHYVEGGTSRMAPQPYMGPAADLHAPRFAAAMAQIAGRVL